MRAIGEYPLSIVPDRKAPKGYKKAYKQYKEVVCLECKQTHFKKLSVIKQYYQLTGYICYDCKQIGKDELRLAAIALAERKKLIAARK